MNFISSFFGKTYKTRAKALGLILFGIYILTSYVANEAFPIQPIVSSLTLLAFLGYTILYVIFIKEISFVINRLFLWYVFFFILTFISFLYSPDELELDNSHFYTFIVNLILLLCLIQYKLEIKDIKFISWIYVVAGALLMYFIIKSGILLFLDERLGGELIGNANAFSVMLMYSAMLSFWLLVYGNCNMIAKIVILSCVCLVYYGMFLSGGKKYIVIPLFFFYLLMLFNKGKDGRQHLLKSTFIISLVCGLVFYLIMYVPTFYDIIGHRMESLFLNISGKEGGEDDIRFRMIDIGLNGWMESPIFGHGANSFKYYNLTMTGHFYYSHNNFVELLFNYGIIGFVLYYSMYYKLFKSAWKIRKTMGNPLLAFPLALIPSLLLFEVGVVSYIFFPVFMLLYFAYALLKQ